MFAYIFAEFRMQRTMASSSVQKQSLFALTGIVVGSVVGERARVIQSVAQRKPDLDAGVLTD